MAQGRTELRQISRLCVALTNDHICAHPLRQDDLDRFHRLKIAFTKIGTQRVEKRKSKLERYREKRRRRWRVQLRAESFFEGQDETEI